MHGASPRSARVRVPITLVAVIVGAAALAACLERPDRAPEAVLPPAMRIVEVEVPFAATGCTTVTVLQQVPLADLAARLPAGLAARAAHHIDPAAPDGMGAVAFEVSTCDGLQQALTAIYVTRPVEGRGLEAAFDFVEVARDVRAGEAGAAPFAEVDWPTGANATDVRAGPGPLGLGLFVEARSAAGNVSGVAYGEEPSGTTTRVWRDLPLGLARVTSTTTGAWGVLLPACDFPEGSPVRDLTGRADCAGARAVVGTGVAWDGTLAGNRLVATGS